MKRFLHIGIIAVLYSGLLLHAQESRQAVVKTFDNESVNRFTGKCSVNVCSKKCFGWPVDVDQFWVSSLYGKRKRPDGSIGWHHGADLAANKGSNVYATAHGKIIFAGFKKGYGNVIEMEHYKGKFKSIYAHLDTIAEEVCIDRIVQKGHYLGSVGDSGNVRSSGNDASHLHFEIYEQDRRIDPLCCLAQSPCS
jgi:murein DD-endopeptidase MepM/ murein hydrolase activator NlpD